MANDYHTQCRKQKTALPTGGAAHCEGDYYQQTICSQWATDPSLLKRWNYIAPGPKGEGATVHHFADSFDAIVGNARLHVSPLHGEHILTYRVGADDSGAAGSGIIGVAGMVLDADARPWHAREPWHFFPTLGVGMSDGHWRASTDAVKISAVSGELLPARPRVGDEITLRIDCRQREVAARSSADPDTWHVIPVRIPDDVHTVMPWCLSVFPGETFTLVSIAAGEATLWAPRSHALFPACARGVAVTLAQLGYHLAARKLPVQSQGPFVDIWLSNVMPFVLDEAGVENLVLGETVARLASHAHRTPPADLGAVFTNPAELPLALRLLWESGSEWHQLAVGHYNVFGFNLNAPMTTEQSDEMSTLVFGDTDERARWVREHGGLWGGSGSCASAGWVCIGAFSEFDYLFICIDPSAHAFGQVRLVTNNCNEEQRVSTVGALVALLLRFFEDVEDLGRGSHLEDMFGRPPMTMLNTPLKRLRSAISQAADVRH